jgi:hypothetical protein
MSRIPLLATVVLGAALAFVPVAHANDAKAAPKTAAEPEREAEHHEPAEGTQQHKMKVCNAEAHEKSLKGDERRAFMSSCLRK